jgi:hypothetical protein
MSEDDLSDHLGFIQDIIDRLSRNSFLLKGWAVTLATGVFVLASRGNSTFPLLAGLLPAVTFWGLDAYFLSEERVFRKLYDRVRKGEAATDGRFSLNTNGLRDSFGDWLRAMASGPLWAFYVAVILTVIVALGHHGN